MRQSPILLTLTLSLAISMQAQEPYSWQRPHAKVLPNGDLEWAPEPFTYQTGERVCYIDYEAGDDANPGTRDKPRKHHPWDPDSAHVAKAVPDFDTYVFKGGVTYRGTLVAKDQAGTAQRPIRLTADPDWGAGPAVLAGSELVTDWHPGAHPKMPVGDELALEPVVVWHADLDFTPRTLWMLADGQVTRIPLARTPNWTVSNPDDIKSEWWAWDNPGRPFGHATSNSRGKQLHLAFDRKHLTEPDEYYKGATLWTEWGWVMGTPFPTVVEVVDQGGLGFSGQWGGPSGTISTGNRYYLEDKPEYLDSPGEFWFDRKKEGDGGRLYVRLPKDRDPRTVRVEAGARSLIVDATKLEHVEISNLSFRYTNVFWALAAGPWFGPDVEPACLRLLGSARNVRLHHCRFEDVNKALRFVAREPTDSIDAVQVTDNVVSRTDHAAFVFRDGAGFGKKTGPVGRLHDLKVMRNKLDHIGMRPTRYGQGHAIEVDCAETLEVAGNILDRCYGSGIFVYGAKRSGFAADRPLARILIHHNKVTDPMLNTNDWGGIETWQGGPAYVFNNLSANPGGYWHYNYIQKNPRTGHRNARFGHAYYLDGAYKNYYFNNLAWGKSNDLESPLANTSAFQEIHSFGNTFFNNTAYRFVVGSRRQAPRGGRNKYLGNVWSDISYRVFRHADPARDAAQANAADAGQQGSRFAYETNAYANNVFHQVARYGVYEASGRWLDSFEDFQQALRQHGAIAAGLGAAVDTAPLRDPEHFDFRPVADSPVKDRGVRVFVPWALHATVGEWHFYPVGNDPATIPDEHWYMAPYYLGRDSYPDRPTFPLRAVNTTAEDYVQGPLEDWTKGALALDGKARYAVLRHADLLPKQELELPAREEFDWISFDTPPAARAGAAFEVKLTTKGIPAGHKLQLDLHQLKGDGSFGGMNTTAGQQQVRGDGTYTFTVTPKDKPRIGSFMLVAYAGPGGWKARTHLARQSLAKLPDVTIDAETLRSPQVRTTSFLLEAYLRIEGGGLIVGKRDGAKGWRLSHAGDKLRFEVAAASVEAPCPVANDWRHIVAEADREARELRLYVDGKQVATGRGVGPDVDLATEADLFVGGIPRGQHITGAIDFLRICLGTLADARTDLAELRAWQFDGPQHRDFTGRAPVGRRDAGALEGE